MSLGLQHALMEDAKEMLAEDEQRKRMERRRGSSKDPAATIPIEEKPRLASISRPVADVTPPAISIVDEDTKKTLPESAEAFAHRRKASQETRPRPKVGAMSSVYGKRKLRLPGDLGRGDPRNSLPGDLGANDPRHSDHPGSKSQSPSGRRREGLESPKSGRPRRASDGALLRPRKKRESTDASDKETRLEKDKDSESSSSDSDSQGSDSDRGRGRARSSHDSSVINSDSDSDDDRKRGFSPSGTPHSPSITVTPPSAGSETHRKKKVHPHSAYDHSAVSTPRNSDDEEHLIDLRRAQKLSLTMSPIHSTPSAHRAIRQIIRGDYGHFQTEAEQGRRRQRVYLVATDLSPEAEYALEWTIGTVLRDGDTLLALYAVDEEGGTGSGGDGVEIGHGADVIRDTAQIVGRLPAERLTQSPKLSPLKSSMRESSTNRIPEKGEKGRAERERMKAAEDISGRVVKLLRKTRLQIRCVVEVFHCKSPRHMITEVIDFLSPTMTILGSRGRSALKGVLLGSFSNYIVTKSSVPVMVARRRLRKHTKQQLHKDGLPVAGTGDGRMRMGRMSNVLEAPPGRRINRLSVAKVD